MTNRERLHYIKERLCEALDIAENIDDPDYDGAFIVEEVMHAMTAVERAIDDTEPQ